MSMIEIGAKAPDFKLEGTDGRMYSISDFKGKKLVLYFYPKDNTSGCTVQNISFAENLKKFETKGVNVVGISRDSIESHKKFAEKYSLSQLLLSDPELEAIKAYGVWQEKKLYGKVSMGVVRTTFVIDENGIITHIMPKAKSKTNAEETLELFH